MLFTITVATICTRAWPAHPISSWDDAFAQKRKGANPSAAWKISWFEKSESGQARTSQICQLPVRACPNWVNDISSESTACISVRIGIFHRLLCRNRLVKRKPPVRPGITVQTCSSKARQWVRCRKQNLIDFMFACVFACNNSLCGCTECPSKDFDLVPKRIWEFAYSLIKIRLPRPLCRSEL